MARNHGVDHTLAHSVTFTCAICGKEAEVPIMCVAEEYGWRIGKKKFCSYTCMRKYENGSRTVEVDPDADWRTGLSSEQVRLTTWRKLRKFIQLRRKGVKLSAMEAAVQAGFATYNSASGARRRWEGQAPFEIWMEEQDEKEKRKSPA